MTIRVKQACALFFLFIFLISCGAQESTEESIDLPTPYYFVAVHCEIDMDYSVGMGFLRNMVSKANVYNIKLTLMFSPQWADYILSDDELRLEVSEWKSRGHEISAHHHEADHKVSWDGFSYLSEGDALDMRSEMGKAEEYLGNMNDYLRLMQQLDSSINSGCMNDENDKDSLTDGIVIDTCLGYANFGEPGTLDISDQSINKAQNDYVSVGYVNGIKRYWLTHALLAENEDYAKDLFLSMSEGVFGVMVHSPEKENEELNAFYELLDFLHFHDNDEAKSVTISEVISAGILQEKSVDHLFE